MTAITFNSPVGLSVGSLGSYIHWANQIPLLTEVEEQDCATRFHEQGDLDAARRLVLAHLRFVIKLARGYAGYGLQQADLIQEGNIGLMKAVKRFDPKKGVRLVTFAVHWIRAEIHEFVIRNWRIVKIATTKAQRKLFFNLRRASENMGWMSDQEITAVSESLNVSEKEVRLMESRLSSFDYSMESDAEDDESSTHVSPVKYLAADSRNNPEAFLVEEDFETQQDAALTVAMKSLDARSQDILKARWLNRKKATLEDLAEKYSVSAERIRQIEQAAMKKVRGQIEASLAG